MCGRFTRRTSPALIAEAFGLAQVPTLDLRYNIAPTQSVAVVRTAAGGGSREFAMLRWGLIPSWADDPAIGNRLTNARSETANTKPSFRGAFRARRCLVICDGFYEWKKVGTKKQPFFIQLKDGRPFAFAGLWERWEKAREPVESCTILTTSANDLMLPIHDRMPVILPPTQYDAWLDPACQDAGRLAPLLSPFASEEMVTHPISTLINHWKNDTPECIAPLSA